MAAGIELTNWFKREIVRVYGVLEAENSEPDTDAILGFIRRRGGSATVRDLVAGIRKIETASQARGIVNSYIAADLGQFNGVTFTLHPENMVN